jgi:oxepin-CoA hydrolase/3-oxo-5,6-dehydrosuberyl-CoA semialdehyde dehydrogenase
MKMPLLRSYVEGSWFTAADQGVPLNDAVTGDEVARVSSAGLDFAGALDYGHRLAAAREPR